MLGFQSPQIQTSQTNCASRSTRRSKRPKAPVSYIATRARLKQKSPASARNTVAPSNSNLVESRSVINTDTGRSTLGSISTDAVAEGETRSVSWSVKDDEILIQARAQGLNWNQISPKHFPNKSANACRKRHERLMERQNAEQWDGVKLDILAQAYLEARREMWSILAARVGGKWTLIEQKCMEKGLKNLSQASRSAHKCQHENHQENHPGIDYHEKEDEGQTIQRNDVRNYSIENPSQELGTPIIQSTLDPNMETCRQSTESAQTTEVNRDASSMKTLDTAHSTVDTAHSTVDTAYSTVDTAYSTVDTAYSTDLNADICPYPEIRNNSVEDKNGTEQFELRNKLVDGISQHQRTLIHTTGGSSSIPHEDSSPNTDKRDISGPSLEPPQRGETFSGSNFSEDEALDMNEESIDDSSSNCVQEIDIPKEKILDRLMVSFYEIFATTSFSTHGGDSNSTPSSSSKRHDSSPGGKSTQTGGKRKCGDRDGEDRDEDIDERSGKRQRNTEGTMRPQSETGKMLACPYYKRHPQRQQPSRACSGPGWRNVPRLKEHLYRQHMMPLHCRRCYIIFENEAQLTEHSRSSDSCLMKEAKPIEGFNKDQEKKLKNRSIMFRAESDEQKWKIVYLILFPDTAHTKLPSPYYDSEADRVSGTPEESSPKPPELKQFDAFMSRELPRKVRKALEVEMEKVIGPIEETLKNQLENIVRGCQDALTQTFLDNTRSLASSSKEGPGPSQSEYVESAHVIDISQLNPTQSTNMANDGLSQYLIPPESIPEPWLDVINLTDNGNIGPPTWSDSTYLSHPENSDPSFLKDAALMPLAMDMTQSFGDRSAKKIYYDPSLSINNQPPQTYVGKGKERAI